MADDSASSAAAAVAKAPSKKELNKLARKEGKKKTEGGLPSQLTAAGDSSAAAALFAVTFCKAASPELTRAVELYLGDQSLLKYLVNKSSSDSSIQSAHLPVLTHLQQDTVTSERGSISGDVNIARYLVRYHVVQSHSSAFSGLYGGDDPWLASQVDQWLDLYLLVSSNAPNIKQTLPTVLNSHLSDKTFLVGSSLTLADISLWCALKKSGFASSSSSSSSSPENWTGLPHTSRWFDLLTGLMPAPTPIPVSYQPVNKTAAAASKGSSASVAEGVTADEAGSGQVLGTCPPLEGAVEGQVCTRFPPEPSGYLHLGHCKAVLLNQYYAQRYRGKLLVRFDDTNPSKEKEEFEDNILRDLATLGVLPDKVSHSSDHFETCEQLAKQMIREGLAYMDNTPQEVMQDQRMKLQESEHRGAAPEESLRLFEELLRGSAEGQAYCLRAKIDMGSVNGTMRDPVLYRFNDTPHHRTGVRFKAYPTYDFVCPIVDSIEGVTHALRTTEYNDRDEQYHWIQQAMRLRPVHILSFGKMNFVHTVLSKRKLTWFVEQGLVEGWFDPRFPTIQGCVRRGMNVDALKSFIISQGASRRVITMEWDKFWSENKKVLEETSPRYMGVSEQGKVLLELSNVPEEVVEHSVQLHPQKPELGLRVMLRSSKVYVDQIDAATYKVGEEVTLLRWGNVTITSIVTSDDEGSRTITKLTGTYDPTATNFSKTKKATWVAAVPQLVPCKLVEFDHLISKAKLGEEDRFEDFVNPRTREETAALCDPCVGAVAAGEVIQLERKGFYRCDVPYGGAVDRPAVLFFIPDGRTKK